MKKYIYTRGEESVIVETDGLGKVDNFMVMGIIGKNYGSLVQAGFCFRMGDEVSIASMLNMAKLCKARVDCFEGNALVEGESADYTEQESEKEEVVLEQEKQEVAKEENPEEGELSESAPVAQDERSEEE